MSRVSGKASFLAPPCASPDRQRLGPRPLPKPEGGRGAALDLLRRLSIISNHASLWPKPARRSRSVVCPPSSLRMMPTEHCGTAHGVLARAIAGIGAGRFAAGIGGGACLDDGGGDCGDPQIASSSSPLMRGGFQCARSIRFRIVLITHKPMVVLILPRKITTPAGRDGAFQMPS